MTFAMPLAEHVMMVASASMFYHSLEKHMVLYCNWLWKWTKHESSTQQCKH